MPEILEQAEKITKPDLFATPFLYRRRGNLVKECDSDVLGYCWKREKHNGSANLLSNSPKPMYLPWE